MKIVKTQKALRQPCKWATEKDPVEEIANNLIATMERYRDADNMAAGLAANQIGYQLRMFVMRVPWISGEGSYLCLVNSQIIKERGSSLAQETCLSFPGKSVLVRRPKKIVITGYTQKWKSVRYQFSDFLARVACHETDHGNGIIILDKAKEG